MKHLVCAALLLVTGSLWAQQQEELVQQEKTAHVVTSSPIDQEKLVQEVAQLRKELARFNSLVFADADKDPKSERWIKAVRIMAILTLAYQTRNAVSYAYRVLMGHALLI